MPRLSAIKRLKPQRRPAPLRMFAAEGQLEVRLTAHPKDVAAAQALRYRVFYEEMAAAPSRKMAAKRRDFDDFDALCDHVLVLDHNLPPKQSVVGTYRLLRHEVAAQSGGFYSAAEFDLSPLLGGRATSGQLLEVGRSCVAADYRNTATIQLLWRGIASYLQLHNITLLFGCASFPGTDPSAHAEPLSFLHRERLAPPEMRVRALPGLSSPMDLIDVDAVSARQALKVMPPLIKAYLRLGAFVGEGAVIDRQFGTTDVFLILPMERVAERYHTHFERDEELEAALPLGRRAQLLGRVLPKSRRKKRAAGDKDGPKRRRLWRRRTQPSEL